MKGMGEEFRVLNMKTWVSFIMCEDEALQTNSRELSLIQIGKTQLSGSPGAQKFPLHFMLFLICLLFVFFSTCPAYLKSDPLFQSKNLKILKTNNCLYHYPQLIVINIWMNFLVGFYTHMKKRRKEVLSICDLPRHKEQNVIGVVWVIIVI